MGVSLPDDHINEISRHTFQVPIGTLAIAFTALEELS